MSLTNRRRRTGFLAEYKLEDKYMLKPDRANGRPGIYGGVSPDGIPVLVKIWARSTGIDDQDLQHIWRHELRQLHRLAGYPGAADCIAHLYDAGYDKEGFYLILSPGQRRPLQSLLNDFRDDHWLKQPKSAANRVHIWTNLKLLCLGLETLHSQGLLHRNLDAWAILTAGGSEPDFQLTGFEWSMRIIGSEGAKPRSSRSSKNHTKDSFLQDWEMFGFMAADLLGVKRTRLLDKSLAPFEVADHLAVEETKLLRNLIQVAPLLALNGETVATKIEDIIRSLAKEIAGRNAKYHLAVRLGNGSSLSDQIRQASGNEIENDDVDAQLAFIVDDLQDAPLLIAIRIQDTGGTRIVLRGKHLLYKLQEYRSSKTTQPTWEFAYCEYAEKNAPVSSNIVGQKLLEPTIIEIMSSATAYDRFPRLRGKLSSWDDLRKSFEQESLPLSREQLAHRALSLLQLLEALYAVADVFPVEILNLSENSDLSGDGDHILNVKTRADSERDALSRILNLKSPALRLGKILDGDSSSTEGWILSDGGSLGAKDPTSSEWQFQGIKLVSGQPLYIFSGQEPSVQLRDPVLIPASSVGRDVQYKRRLKALKALKDHQELLRMIADTRHRVIESHDTLLEDGAFGLLDSPKQDALRQITSTLPLYMVQGPPGVGKTRLVRDLVQRRFTEEPTSRLLLTAQSNAAIDHLMDELEEILNIDTSDKPLVVRCSGKDSVEAPSHFDIREQSKQLVQLLAKSKLAKTVPGRLQGELNSLATASLGASASNAKMVSGRAANQALRAFEGVVARAANIVFATTNSGELERLIDERGQFDWAIVEEAAKATGSELIAPLLLSHRRLMIGDHKQLPAFASDQLKKLLAFPDRVQEALKLGEEFIGRTLRDETTDEIFDDVEDNENGLPALCAEGLKLLTFFETAIEAEFQRQKIKKSGRPIAKKLTAQHRMHPVIANLVSRCFYGDLETDPDCAERFTTSLAPFDSIDYTRLPLKPIVVIDMPYVQSKLNQKEGDRDPAWHNPLEVSAILRALSLLVVKDGISKPPTLAVLSPYNQQVRRINTAIQEEKNTSLSNLSKFRAPSHSGEICHTVDSFQGSEADIVLVSLVRNNGHSSIHQALGFLCDLRRMNVLLSRAKWQLVIVTSLDFLHEILNAVKGSEDEEKIKFLAEMLQVLGEGVEDKSVACIPFDHLMKGFK